MIWINIFLSILAVVAALASIAVAIFDDTRNAMYLLMLAIFLVEITK